MYVLGQALFCLDIDITMGNFFKPNVEKQTMHRGKHCLSFNYADTLLGNNAYSGTCLPEPDEKKIGMRFSINFKN